MAKVDGLDRFAKYVNSLPDEMSKKVKDYVELTGHKMVAEMKNRAPFDTGHLSRNINVSMDIKNQGATATVGTGTVDYAEYVEFGTVYQSPQSFFFPIVDKYKPKIANDIKNLMREVGD